MDNLLKQIGSSIQQELTSKLLLASRASTFNKETFFTLENLNRIFDGGSTKPVITSGWDGDNNLTERITWAITKPPKITKKIGTTIGKQKVEAQKLEKEWGNAMIGQTNNGQWTTLLGEGLVYDVLKKLGENPVKVQKRNGFEPDWETDNYMYEVKTRNWNVSGTAGEKVLGTWIKYQSIPEIYGKPLRIVCVGFQEWELTHGKTKYFGDTTCKTQQLLDISRSWGITYLKFSELVAKI